MERGADNELQSSELLKNCIDATANLIRLVDNSFTDK